VTGRVSQVAVEVVVQPDAVAARVSQVAVEAIALPNDVRARVSQLAVEVLRQRAAVPSPTRTQVMATG
jgi:hypothetical protein